MRGILAGLAGDLIDQRLRRRAGGGPVPGRPAVGPGGRRPAARRPGHRGRTPPRRSRGIPDRLAPFPGPAGAAGTGPAGDLRRPPATRSWPAAGGHSPAARRPAAPAPPRRPALPAGLRPGARGCCRARRAANRARPARPHPGRGDLWDTEGPRRRGRSHPDAAGGPARPKRSVRPPTSWGTSSSPPQVRCGSS